MKLRQRINKLFGGPGFSNSATVKYKALLESPVFIRWAKECQSKDALSQRLEQNCVRYSPQKQGVYKDFTDRELSKIQWDEIAERLIQDANL